MNCENLKNSVHKFKYIGEIMCDEKIFKIMFKIMFTFEFSSVSES